MIVKIILPNNLGDTVDPGYINPKILDAGLIETSFTNWGQINFPLNRGEVVLTLDLVTTTGDYFLDLRPENIINSVRVVLVEVKKNEI